MIASIPGKANQGNLIVSETCKEWRRSDSSVSRQLSLPHTLPASRLCSQLQGLQQALRRVGLSPPGTGSPQPFRPESSRPTGKVRCRPMGSTDVALS